MDKQNETIKNLPETNVHISYMVTYVGFYGYFPPDCYSKYNDRLVMRDKGEIKDNEVYGYEQALEHVAEIREQVYRGEKVYANAYFQIEIKSTTTTKIAI